MGTGKNVDPGEEYTHSVLRLNRNVIGNQYQVDDDSIPSEPIEHIDVIDTSDPWEYRVGAGRGGTSHAVNWPNGNGNRTPGGQCDSVLDTPNINGTPYVVTTKVPCNKVTEEIKEEVLCGFMEEFGKELKNEISNLAPDLRSIAELYRLTKIA